MTVLTRAEVSDVFVNNREMLESVLRNRTGCPHVAEDLSQNLYFKVDRLAERFTSSVDVRRFLVRMAINAATDHYRVERRRCELMASSTVADRDQDDSLETDLMTKSDMRQVEKALSELPAKCRDILYLSRIKGMNHAQIAEQLGVSRSLVDKYAVRALVHCRLRLQQLAAS